MPRKLVKEWIVPCAIGLLVGWLVSDLSEDRGSRRLGRLHVSDGLPSAMS